MAMIWHVIGNSPSILEEDLSRLKNTIGLNRILRHPTFRPEYLIIVDSNCQRQEMERLRKYEGRLISCPELRWPGFKVEMFTLTERGTKMTSFAGPFCRAGNTAHYAIEWAARRIHAAGRRGKILLHGCDMRYGKTLSHFFGSRDISRELGCSPAGFGTALGYIRRTTAWLKDYGITVRDVSPWRRTPMKQALEGV